MTYLHFIKEFMVDNHDVILMHLSVYKYEQMQMVHDIIISHYIPNINYFPLESKQILNFHDGVLLNNEMDTMTTIQYKYKLNSYVGMETINMYKNTDILNI